jgi:hypothetical protein
VTSIVVEMQSGSSFQAIEEWSLNSAACTDPTVQGVKHFDSQRLSWIICSGRCLGPLFGAAATAAGRHREQASNHVRTITALPAMVMAINTPGWHGDGGTRTLARPPCTSVLHPVRLGSRPYTGPAFDFNHSPRTPPLEELAQVIEHGGYAELLRTLNGLNERQRKSAAVWLLAQWKTPPAAPHPQEAVEPLARWMRLLVGLTAAATEPKKALAIPVRHAYWEYRVAWSTDRALSPASAEAVAALAEAAIGHGAQWCSQFLALVLDAKKPKPMFVEVLQLIAQAHGLALHDTPIAAQLWATRFSALLPPEPRADLPPYVRDVQRFELKAHDGRFAVSGRDERVTTAADGLRGALDSEAMLLATFDHRDALFGIAGSQHVMEMAAAVVGELVADGTVDAARLAKQVIAALSRGDSVSCQRLQTRLLKVAQPNAALVTEQARVLANLLASGNATPAAAAQELLRHADAAQALPDDVFADACEMAFARKEKGLRDGQLVWAGERAARAATVASAASGLTAALSCPDHTVQKQAATVLAAAWPQLSAGQRTALLAPIEASQGTLDETLFRQLWAACTGAAAPVATKPARAQPVRTGMTRTPYEPVADPAHLPADVMRALQTYHTERDAMAFERLIGAAHDSLRAGQLPLARAIGTHLKPHGPFGMFLDADDRVRCEMSYVAMARLQELAKALDDGTPRHFISTPSWTHGAITPQHLAERLAALAEAGEAALPVDLLVALLRTEPCDAQALTRLRALGAIGSADALVAADFLAAGGSAQLATRWRVLEGGDAAPSWRQRYGAATWVLKGEREVCVAMSAVAQPPRIDGAPRDWAAGFEPSSAPFVSEFDMLPDWIAPMLPHNAEALAALHLYGFRRAGLEHGTEGGKAVAVRLPLFLVAHGEAGPALHLAVFFAMSANDAPVRLAGSDGMVTLLQQGRWRDSLAAELIAACVRCGSVKPGRLATSLAQVREAGEAEAVWSLARAAIAAALGMTPVPSATAELIALGAETAAELDAKEPMTELDAAVAAIKGKPNKLQLQAQRLHAVLAR